MFNWFLTYFERIFGIAGGILLLGLAIGFLHLSLNWPSPLRWRVNAAIVLVGLVAVIGVLRGGPGGKDTTPQLLDPDREIDISLSAIERLQADWEAYDDPRWPVLETLAVFSDIAYDSPVFAAERYREHGFTECFPVFTHSMVGYVIAAEDVAVVVFRGTDFNEWSDWGVNKSVRITPTAHGMVHGGFDRAYSGLAPQVDKLLDRIEPERLWVTGHSLGGALATLCAYRIETRGKYSVSGLITFGQPMVAKLDLAEHLDQLFDNRYAWIVNGKDIVPKTPPKFEPAGSLVHLDGTGRPGRWRRMRASFAAGNDENMPSCAIDPIPTVAAVNRRRGQILQRQIEMEPPSVFKDQPLATAMALPEKDDHLMLAYLASIRRHLGIEE